MFTKQLLMVSIFCLAGLQIGPSYAVKEQTVVTDKSTSSATGISELPIPPTVLPPNATNTTAAPPTTISPSPEANTTTVPTSTTQAPNTTTVAPQTTTPNGTITTSTASTTTHAPNSTTSTTPVPPTNTTSVKPDVTSVSPTASPNPTAEPSKDRRFDGPSFIGGIVLSLGIMAIAFVSWKFYKARSERNYHTL